MLKIVKYIPLLIPALLLSSCGGAGNNVKSVRKFEDKGSVVSFKELVTNVNRLLEEEDISKVKATSLTIASASERIEEEYITSSKSSVSAKGERKRKYSTVTEVDANTKTFHYDNEYYYEDHLNENYFAAIDDEAKTEQVASYNSSDESYSYYENTDMYYVSPNTKTYYVDKSILGYDFSLDVIALYKTSLSYLVSIGTVCAFAKEFDEETIKDAFYEFFDLTESATLDAYQNDNIFTFIYSDKATTKKDTYETTSNYTGQIQFKANITNYFMVNKLTAEHVRKEKCGVNGDDIRTTTIKSVSNYSNELNQGATVSKPSLDGFVEVEN